MGRDIRRVADGAGLAVLNFSVLLVHCLLFVSEIQTVCRFFEERELALAGQFLYRSFTACSRDLVGQVFKVYGLQRSASSRILGAFAAAVRGKALFEIIRPAGIERAVFAFKDIDAGAAVTDGLHGRFRTI